MKRMLQISMLSGLVLILAAGIVLAAGLAPKDAKILEDAGIPVFQGAQFVNGSLGGDMGARFAISAPVEDVRAFYKAKFPSWALNDEYGSWILYNGEPGGGPAAYMGKQQVSVVENKNLPSWFGLDKSMTTEIIVVVPE